jgi:hypothetical protein
MMNRWCKRLLILALLVPALAPLRAEESDKEVQARRVALDLAGAFSNDGFKIRDGHWSGTLKQGEPAIVAVNLYAGNQYWFSVGANEQGNKLSVQLYDENGQPLSTESFEAEDKAAAGFSPTGSGQYFVVIAATEASTPTVCLVYSYK